MRESVTESHPLMRDVAERLRARGERMTRPRRAVVGVLAAGQGHLTADEVVSAVAVVDPAVHRSSVYRTLDALVGLGVVQHIRVEKGVSTFHVIQGGRPHLHAHCQGCDAVVDLPADLLDGVGDVLSGSHDFVLDPARVALSGWCGPCR